MRQTLPGILHDKTIQTRLRHAFEAPVVRRVPYECPHIGVTEEIPSSWNVDEWIFGEILTGLDDTDAERGRVFRRGRGGEAIRDDQASSPTAKDKDIKLARRKFSRRERGSGCGS